MCLNLQKLCLLLIVTVLPFIVKAQQLEITDFVVFGGSSSCPACSVQMGSASTVNGGSAILQSKRFISPHTHFKRSICSINVVNFLIIYCK